MGQGQKRLQGWGQVQECSRWGCWCPGRARVGWQLSPCPVHAHPGLAPSPAHTLFRGLGNTASEIPTIPSSPNVPARLPSKRDLHSKELRRGRAWMAQKTKSRSVLSPHHPRPLGKRERLLELPWAQDPWALSTCKDCLPTPPSSLPSEQGPPWETKHSLPDQDRHRFLSRVGQ